MMKVLMTLGCDGRRVGVVNWHVILAKMDGVIGGRENLSHFYNIKGIYGPIVS